MPLESWRNRKRKPRPDLAARNRANAKHGGYGSPEWKTWDSMKQRCLNPSCKDFPRYGGRGITVCDRWRDSFPSFLEDMGKRPAGTSLGRIDNERGYEPGNCRWETQVEQQNNRRSNRTLTADGRTQTLAQWAREIGVSDALLRYRLDAGWPPAAALDPTVDRRLRRL